MSKSSGTQNTQYQNQQNTVQDATSNQTQNSSQTGTQNITGTGATAATGTQYGTQGPWAAAQPTLYSLLSGVNSQIPNTGLSSNEQAALNQMLQNAGTTPNYAPQAQDLTNKFLTGDPTGLLNPALQQYQNQLNPIANADLDPLKTPGLQNYLQTLQSDITNQVNGQFAGAGRDLSGLNQLSLARGITQGLSPTVFKQYNDNINNRLGAAAALFGGTGATAGAQTNNYGSAQNFANWAANAPNVGAQQTLAAEAARRGIPVSALQALQGISVPIAGLGTQTEQQTAQQQQAQTQQKTESQVFADLVSQLIAHQTGTANTSGTQTTQTSQTPSLLSSLLGGVNLATGLFGTGTGGGLFSR